MKYILLGLLVSVGWHLGVLIYEILAEIIFNELHKTKWYCVLNGKKYIPKQNTDSVKMKIGF